MILILAKAAGCSWTTAKELLLMYIAERNLQPDELARSFDRYAKLSQETARNLIDFHRERVKLRMQNGSERGSEDVRAVNRVSRKNLKTSIAAAVTTCESLAGSPDSREVDGAAKLM